MAGLSGSRPIAPYRIEIFADGSTAPILELAEEGRKQSPYGHHEFPADAIPELQKLATVFVLWFGDTPVGFLAAVINERGPILKGTKVATELFWYVTPSHRGTKDSIKLIVAYEMWAEQNGCKLASICNMRNEYMERLGRLYERLGYHKAEETYLKELP